MKAQQQLRATQQLVLTPQMRNAIRLLQLSNLELVEEITEVVESNPLLEYDDDPSDESNSIDEPEHTADQESETAEEEIFSYEDVEPQATGLETETLGNALENDPGIDLDAVRADPAVEWNESYSSGASEEPYRPEPSYSFESLNMHGVTMRDHLLHQALLLNWSEKEFTLLEHLIDALDEDGYLRTSLEHLCTELQPQLHSEVAELEAVLQTLQTFEPNGIGARSLQECMLIQLRDTQWTSPAHEHALRIVRDFIDELAAGDDEFLKRQCNLTDSDWDAASSLMSSLNPRPGAAFANVERDYVVPEVLVRRAGAEWIVELDDAFTPRIRVSSAYELESAGVDKETRNYLRVKSREAQLLVAGFQYRNSLLLRVATEIVTRQRAFLDKGEAAMLPMVLADIADSVGVHESTISRITSRKYMATPRGVFELKYFFSSSVSTTGGREISSTAIRAMIREMTKNEDKTKPLSDNTITNILRQRDIDIARRTVAKYRESMSIPSSKQRRQSA